MNELAQKHCIQVNINTPRLGEDEIDQLKKKFPAWNIFEINGETRMETFFQFKDFKQAMAFSNKIALIANEENHHPAILTEWGKVTVTWWTHTIHGLHQNDFIMAAKTEELYSKGS